MAAAEEVVKDVGRAIEETLLAKREKEKRKLKQWRHGSNTRASYNIPRFDYTAPSSLLHHSHSGFLVTCSITYQKERRVLPRGHVHPWKGAVALRYSVESLPVCEIWSSEGASLVPSDIPVQATCALTEKELQETVSKLVQRFVDDKQNTLSTPVKFAAGYNRRGVEEAKGKIQKASEVLDQCPLLDRTKCFETVAAGVKAIVPDSVVDLKSRSYVLWWNSYRFLEYQMAPM
ncbi:hypothetical protein HID58_080856 [Brassica napus]|uniref:Uncharacterized protein n=1 Tax=Brassica napus TaxID=3708 RepID=A0ABQ7Y623_BRANA|nr:hypothetical protein HID58_080856 [Brassica napus]